MNENNCNVIRAKKYSHIRKRLLSFHCVRMVRTIQALYNCRRLISMVYCKNIKENSPIWRHTRNRKNYLIIIHQINFIRNQITTNAIIYNINKFEDFKMFTPLTECNISTECNILKNVFNVVNFILNFYEFLIYAWSLFSTFNSSW